MAKPDDDTPRRNALTRLSAELPGLTKTAFRNTLGGRGFAEAGLITEWASIVGDEIARVSQPLQLGFPRGERKGGVLTIACSGAAALELQHLKPQILERVNTHFGYGAVAELRFKQGQVAIGSRRRNSAQPESQRLSDAEIASVTREVESMPEGPVKASLMRYGLSMRRKPPGR